MLVEKLIQELKKLPPKTQVVLIDYEKNEEASGCGEPSSDGVYPDFEVKLEPDNEGVSFGVIEIPN